MSGKIPSSRAKSWRFAKGYLKKTGYVSDFLVDKAKESVTLKTGVVGIQVQIMLPDTKLPDNIDFIDPEAVLKAAAEAQAKAKAKVEAQAMKEEKSEEAVEEKAAPKVAENKE